MKKLNLGVLYKNGKIVNHRSLLKVLLNPFLRTTGFEIQSEFTDNQDFKKYVVKKLDKEEEFIWDPCFHSDFDKIEKVRRII